MKAKLFDSIVLFLCLFVTGDVALKCYVCDSSAIYDSSNVCLKIPAHPLSNLLIADCSTEWYPFSYPYNDSKLWKGCRKYIQRYDDKERLVRSCAREPLMSRGDECFTLVKTSRSKTLIQVTCDCNTETCNMANSVGFSIFFLGIVTIHLPMF